MYHRLVGCFILLIILAGCGGNQAATQEKAVDAKLADVAAALADPTAPPVSGSGLGQPQATAAPPQKTEAPAPTTAPAPTAVPALGAIDERIVIDGVAYTASAVEQKEQVGPYTTAKDGEIFATLVLTIENVENEKAVSYNPLYATLRDVDGYRYSTEFTGDSQEFKYGDLAKGDTIKGTMAFRIPAAAQGLVFEYKALSFDERPPFLVALDDYTGGPTPVEGQRSEQDGIALTVVSVERTEKLFVPAEAGKEFVVIDLLVENISNPAALSVNPFYFKAKDADSFEYTFELVIDLPSLREASLAAGERNRGVIAFEVPKGAVLNLTFEPLGRQQPDAMTIPIAE